MEKISKVTKCWFIFFVKIILKKKKAIICERLHLKRGFKTICVSQKPAALRGHSRLGGEGRFSKENCVKVDLRTKYSEKTGFWFFPPLNHKIGSQDFGFIAKMVNI